MTDILLAALINYYNGSARKRKNFYDGLRKAMMMILLSPNQSLTHSVMMENSMVTLIMSPMIRQPIHSGTSLKVEGGMLRMIEILNRIRKKMKLWQKVLRAFGKRLTYFVSPFLNKPKTFYHSSFVVLHPSLSDRIPSVIPEYFGVAKLGILLAQEIAKHFDLIAVGVDTFSNDTYEALVRKTNDLWGDFYWPPMEDNNIVLSEKSPIFNELIADNTAFRMVTDYLKNKMDVTDQLPWIQYDFTAEKITYISVAQEFCRKFSAVAFARDVFEGRRLPFPIKIKNMMENSESYSRTFKCPTNTLETVSSDHWIQFPYIKIEDRPNNY
ncbi:hypothetical protein JTB14_020904 [Gonioctena quinquepunctata]|nr:hypothetical protein JTB14_020904 [Gonioctena quinquepunctata]